jgi:hypothetical protein
LKQHNPNSGIVRDKIGDVSNGIETGGEGHIWVRRNEKKDLQERETQEYLKNLAVRRN